MVNLTRIYTRTGDAGTTRLGDNSEASKTDTRLAAYADVDEANAHLGVAIACGSLEDDVVAVLTHVQNDLFDVGADLCTPVVADPEYPPLRVEQAYVDRLEGWCDEYNESARDAPLVHPLRRHPRLGPPARRAHRRTARGAVVLGRVGRLRRHDEPAGDHLPQPPERPGLHPGPLREPRARGRVVGAGRGTLRPMTTPRTTRRTTPLAAAAALALAATALVTSGPATAAPSGGSPSYHLYVQDVYGADLGACRESAHKGKAYRIRGLVDASGATRNDIIGGLVVLKGGQETSHRFLSGKVAAGQSRTGSVIVAKSGYTISGFVGIDGAGDSFTKAPGAIKAC